jgi:outer membrane protein assembly factor BamA
MDKKSRYDNALSYMMKPLHLYWNKSILPLKSFTPNYSGFVIRGIKCFLKGPTRTTNDILIAIVLLVPLILPLNAQPIAISKINIISDSLDEKAYLREISLQINDPVNDAAINAASNKILEYALNRGFIFAKVNVKPSHILKVDHEKAIQLTFHVVEGKKYCIKGIRFRGNHYTKDHVIFRELLIKKGDAYSKEKLEATRKALLKLNYFREVETPEVFTTEDDSLIVLFPFKEGNAALFDGVVGYVPENPSGKSTNDGGYFTGRIHISLRNLFGTGRKFKLFWEKPDQLSEQFLLRYNEPYIFNLPVHIGFSVERTVRDSSYIQWAYGVNARLKLLQNLSLITAINVVRSNPDSASSANLGLLQNRILKLNAGLEYDSRENTLNPRAGFYYKTEFIYGYKTNLGPDWAIKNRAEQLLKSEQQAFTMRLEWYYNLWLNQVLSLQAEGLQVKSKDLQLTDYYWFGGLRSLRGYRENQFRGNIIAWSNFEYRFLTGKYSRFFLFTDYGYYKNPNLNKREFLFGYGLGVRFETPLGLIGADFGLGRGDDFSYGKLHFGIMNQF